MGTTVARSDSCLKTRGGPPAGLRFDQRDGQSPGNSRLAACRSWASSVARSIARWACLFAYQPQRPSTRSPAAMKTTSSTMKTTSAASSSTALQSQAGSSIRNTATTVARSDLCLKTRGLPAHAQWGSPACAAPNPGSGRHGVRSIRAVDPRARRTGLRPEEWLALECVSLFYLARLMGTSVEEIDRTYGHLLPDSEDYLRGLLDAYDTSATTSISTDSASG
jgi:hypothetical protein